MKIIGENKIFILLKLYSLKIAINLYLILIVVEKNFSLNNTLIRGYLLLSISMNQHNKISF